MVLERLTKSSQRRRGSPASVEDEVEDRSSLASSAFHSPTLVPEQVSLSHQLSMWVPLPVVMLLAGRAVALELEFKRSYMRRRGQSTKAQKAALRELWPRYGITTITHGSSRVLDCERLFGRAAPLLLDVGFGAQTAPRAKTLCEKDPLLLLERSFKYSQLQAWATQRWRSRDRSRSATSWGARCTCRGSARRPTIVPRMKRI